MYHPQRAPTSTSFGMRWPLRWRATSDSTPPTQDLPMNTAGTGFGDEIPPWTVAGGGGGGREAISWSSSWMTVGWTPMVTKSFFMTKHIQQEDRLKMMTGCSDINRLIRASVDSSSSKERAAPVRAVVVVIMGMEDEQLRSLFSCQKQKTSELLEWEGEMSTKGGIKMSCLHHQVQCYIGFRDHSNLSLYIFSQFRIYYHF